MPRRPKAAPPTAKRHRATDRRGAVGYVFTFNDAETAKATVELEAYCAGQGLQLREVLSDSGNDAGASAAGLQERKGGSALLMALLAQDDRRHLIVRRVDDLGTVKDLQLFLGVLASHWRYLHIVRHRLTTERNDATGKLLGTLVGSLSRMVERELRAMSTRSTLRPLLAGGVPYGWDRVGNRLVFNPHQQAVRAAVRVDLEAGMSLRKVAAKLNEAGERSKQGRLWNARSVSDLKWNRDADNVDMWQGSHIDDPSWREHLRRGEVLGMLRSDPEGREVLKRIEAKQDAKAIEREARFTSGPTEETWEERRQRGLTWG